MNVAENFRLALESLRANLTRTLLTLLGIVIGVGAVIGVVAIGRGGQILVVQEVEGLGGTGMVWVEPNWMAEGDFFNVEQLIAADLDAIASLPGVAGASPMVMDSMEARLGATSRRFSASGVAPDYQAVRNLRLAAGRFFNAADLAAANRTVVIDDRVRKQFFGDNSAVGETLWLDGRPFTVVGELAPQTGLMAQLGGSGEALLLPYTTVQRLTGTDEYMAIFVHPADQSLVEGVIEDIKAALAHRHDPERFIVNSMEEVVAGIRRVTNIMTLVVAGIAGIALLVGGIGIMNIMLVSVTERTREIGLRKAIGARQKDIRRQFLIEAIVLTSSGGLIGILLSTGLVGLASAATGLPALVTPGSVLLAFGFSALVGIVFGVYPAGQAGRLDPIQALRHE